MNANLRRKLDALIQDESKTEVDQKLLNSLQALAAGETLYEQFDPIQRNTLNEFFREVRDYLLEEVIKGIYGTQIVLDAVIVLAFETGYKARGGQLFAAPLEEKS